MSKVRRVKLERCSAEVGPLLKEWEERDGG
jgi:hypothetical protein